MLRNVMDHVRYPGVGPFESWDPEHMVSGGETLELAGMRIDVVFTPGHSPGHVTYVLADERLMFSGDVLFRGSIGRFDTTGGDGPTLIHSIQALLEAYPDETVVHPGHGGLTTLGAERASNPYLAGLPA